MDDLDRFSFFVFKVFPAAILLFGLLGNLIGYVVLSSRNLKKLGTRNIYQYLFIFDTLYLLQLIILYMQFGFGGVYDLTVHSSLFCKVFNFLNYSMATISPMMIIFISIERYISTKYPSKRAIFKKKKTHILYLTGVCVYLGGFYLVYPFFYDVLTIQSTNNTNGMYQTCNFVDIHSQLILSFLYLANSSLMPFIIMLTFSILLSYSIFQSRKRIASHHTNEENKTFKRDLKFTITSLCLNLIFILLNLPVSIAILFPDYQSSIIFVFCYFLFYSSYGVNFYILLAFNSIIRKEFFYMFRFRFVSNKPSTNNTKPTAESQNQNSSVKHQIDQEV